MSDRRFFVITASGGEMGPHTRQELAELVREGRISRDDRLRTAFGANVGFVADQLSETDHDQESDHGILGVPAVTGQFVSESTAPSDSDRAVRGDRMAHAPRRKPLLPVGIAICTALIAGAGWWLSSNGGGGDHEGQPLPPTREAGPPVATISAVDASWELGRPGSITVQLDKAAEHELTIPLVVGGSAVSGVDVTALAPKLTIHHGATSVFVPVDPLPPSAGRTPAAMIAVELGSQADFRIGDPRLATLVLRARDRRAGDPRVVWLDELPFASEASFGKPPCRNTNQSGKRMVIQGVAYARGISMHAGKQGVDKETHALVRLDGAYDEFLSDVGVDDEERWGGSVVFQVLLDGRKAYDSGMIGHRDKAKSVRIPVTGIKELRLVVLDAGDGNKRDDADWGGARLLAKP